MMFKTKVTGCLVGLMLLMCAAALPCAASVATCGGSVRIEYVAGPQPAVPGDVLRVRMTMFTGSITGGENPTLTFERVRFDLDCDGDATVGLPCTNDDDVVSFEGIVRSDNCFDADLHPVSFGTLHSPGDTTPNEVVFTPSAPVVMPANTGFPGGCVLEFDVKVQVYSNDSTPYGIEEVGGFLMVDDVPDAFCSNELPSLSSTNARIELALPTATPTDTPTPAPTPTCTPTSHITDHFQCHGAHIKKGSTPFMPLSGVTLIDQFGTLTVNVKKPVRLCAPADKNDEDPTAPSHPDHLTAYPIAIPRGAPRFVKVPNQKVVNQFGMLIVDVLKPVRLLVPSAKSLLSPPLAPPDPLVDHFDCYSVRVTRGTPEFTAIKGVAVEDQFGPLTVNVENPTLLCAPANKNNENPGAEAHADHLMCYRITVPRGSPRFKKISPVFATDQFAQQTLDVVTLGQLCVPSLKNP